MSLENDNKKPKVENTQQWLVRRINDKNLFVISSFYKKTPWMGLEAAIFNSNAPFYCLSILDYKVKALESKRLRDLLVNIHSNGQRMHVVFTKWEDCGSLKGRNGAVDYRLVTESEEVVFEAKNLEVIIEI